MVKKKLSYKTTRKSLSSRRYMCYSALQATVQDLGITTRFRYESWVRKQKPLSVPLNPWRVYHEWTTWGDFLGTDHVFIPYMKWQEMRKNRWRTYWECARWVHKQNYKSAKEFTEAHKRGEVPKDIPKSPHQVYSDKYKGGWTDWPTFLGSNIQKKVQFMQEIKEHTQMLFAIAAIPAHPHNYFTVLIAPEGKEQLAELVSENGTNAFRVYEFEEKDQGEIGNILKRTASPQGGSTFIANNMNNVFFELDSFFLYNMELGNEILKKIQKT